MITLQNNTGRGKTVKIFFSIMLGLNLISACFAYLQFSLLQDAQNGIAVTQSQAANNTIRQVLISMVLLTAIIGSMITFIMWYYRAYKNLHLLNITSLNFEAGWAIGAWFVPFLNLGRPYMIMRETWEETQYYFLPKEEKHLVSSPAIVGWWWGLYLTGNIAGYVLVLMPTHGLENLSNFTLVSIASHAFNAGVLVIALLMIIQMQGYEKRLKQFVEEQNNLPPVVVEVPVMQPVTPVHPSGYSSNTTPE